MNIRLGTACDGSRDGLLIVSRPKDEGGFWPCSDQYTSMLDALEDWDRFVVGVESGSVLVCTQPKLTDALPIGPALRRTWQALYASAFGNRAVRVSQSATSGRSDDSINSRPLMYQGASDRFLGPGEAIEISNEEAELDFEPEIAVITNDVPQGTRASEAHRHIRLVVLLNDFTYRAIVKWERETHFGFVQGKPISGMAPFACTPTALGDSWRDGMLHATVKVSRNGNQIGSIPTHEMQYTFHDLIQHAAATRSLAAGTIISSGTVSSSMANGAASLIEIRALESARGEQMTPYLRSGDEVAIEAIDDAQRSLFGSLRNKVW
jgi:fumarylacetoacetate (FAA) hydrolase